MFKQYSGMNRSPARSLLRRVAMPVFCALALGGSALAQPVPGGAPTGPREVGTVALESAEVPYTVTVPGRAAAVDRVEIRPRVDGLIAEVRFHGGEEMAAGDLLFGIEDDVYRAEVNAAEAAVESSRAAVSAAESKVRRYEQIVQTGITAIEYETAQSDLAAAQSALSSAEASLQLARIDLDRTLIRAPIAGIVDVADVSVGDVVTANQTDALTMVTRLDPIYVDIAESSIRILRNRERIDQGIIRRGQSADLRLTLENGTLYEAVGTFVAPGITVSSTTGTRTMRLSFPNPERKILPGQFLRVDVTLGTTEAILVPQGATSRTGEGTLTAFIARDGVANRVELTETGTYRNAWIVTDGVAPGDLLIVDGLTDLRPGAEVSPVAVTISPTGVVTDQAGDPPSPKPAAEPDPAQAPAGSGE